MKNTYISPEIVIVRLDMTRPIAGSLEVTGTTGSATFFEEGATGEGMAKGVTDINIWDDEW